MRALQSQAKWLEVFAKAKTAEAANERLKSKREALREIEDQHQEQIRPIRWGGSLGRDGTGHESACVATKWFNARCRLCWSLE